MISHEAAGSFYDDFQKPPDYLPLKPDEDHNQQLITPDTRHLSTPAVDLLVAATTVGSTVQQPSTFYNPRSVSRGEPAIPTVEQQMYAQPFIEAFNQRIRQDTSSPVGSDIQCHSPPNISHHSFVSTGTANPSLASTAPTYVTATMSDINTLMPPSEASTSFSVTSTHDPTGFSSSYMPIPTYNHSHTAAPEAYPALLPGFNVIAQAAPSGQGPLQSQGFPTADPQSTMSQEMLRQIVPADMKTMEYMKVERKKARNRIAASKCRLRRLQRESDLQEKVRRLKDHNQELNNELNSLREKVHNLKRVLMKHMRTGCSVELPQGIRTDSLSSTGSEV